MLWLLVACSHPLPDPVDVAGPLDDVLRLHHLQAVGTHNSYHATSDVDRPEWAYEHRPLWEQAAFEGVRQFELDLYWNDERDGWDVLHVPILDPNTTCPTLRGCLWSQRVWSASRPDHHPIVTLVEVKTRLPDDAAEADRLLGALEDAILDVWPRDRLIVPDDLRGDAPTVRDALAPQGWPVLRGLRGRAVYVLHDRAWIDHYTGGEDRPGGLLFPDAYGDLDRPYAAVHSMNDPDDPRIADVVAAGHLVRTRADADQIEAAAGDTARRDRALASGAHFVSTDWPHPHPDTGYVVAMPGGTPSRCNPVTAPLACTSEAIESP